MKSIVTILISALTLLSTALAKDAPDTTGAGSNYKNIDAKAAIALTSSKEAADLVILDVRTPDEYAEGHCAKARLIDAFDPKFAEKLAALDKDAPYLLHCASGGRSIPVFEKMKALGFKEVYHLDGGFSAWEKAGGKVEK